MLKLINRFCIVGVFLCFYTAAPLFSQPAMDFEHDTNKKKLHSKNSWLKTSLSYDDALRITTFNFAGHDFAWPVSHSVGLSEQTRGFETVFYLDHPSNSTKHIPLKPVGTPEIIKKTTPTVCWKFSAQSPSLALTRQYAYAADASVIFTTSSLTNRTQNNLVLYPTEVLCQNTDQENGKKPYLFSPIHSVLKTTIGKENQPNISTIDTNMLSVEYQNQAGEFVFSTTDHWAALFDAKNGMTCGYEVSYKSENIEDVTNNRILFMNGAGTFEQHGRVIMRTENTDPFMRMKMVLGKLTLKPGETFSYNTRISASACPGPIYGINNGIAVNTPLKAYTLKTSYILLGAFGIPRLTKIGFDFWDAQGNLILKNYDISLDFSSLGNPPRPAKAVPNYQTWLAHQIGGFSTIQNGKVIDNTDKVAKIRFVMTDEAKNVTGVIAETEGPFAEYSQPIFPVSKKGEQ